MPTTATNRISLPKEKGVFWLLTIQLILLYFPILQFFSLADGKIPASACYFFSVSFLPYLVKKIRTLRLPPWYLTALYGYVILWAIVRAPQYGLSKSILHWLFGFYLLVVILNVGAGLSAEDWLRMLETAACVFAVVHFVFILFHWDVVWYLLQEYFSGQIDAMWGARLPSLTRGGRNLDCSWLGLGAFFVRGRKKAFYVTYVLLFSFLGTSRVGIIAVGIAILWSLVYDPLYRLTKKSFKWYALYAVVLLAVLFCSGMAQAVLSRMTIQIPAPAEWFPSSVSIPASGGGPTPSGGMEKMLSGRGAIWGRAPQMFRDNPFGYGVGNAMRVMKASYGFTSYEDVVHNVFLQWLLDEGILGGLAYLGLLAAFLCRQWKNRPHWFASPFDGYFLAYFVLSLVQFHGGEALMIFVLGVYLIQTDARCVRIGRPGKG